MYVQNLRYIPKNSSLCQLEFDFEVVNHRFQRFFFVVFSEFSYSFPIFLKNATPLRITNLTPVLKDRILGSRIEGLLSFKVSDPFQQLVTESLQRYAMSQATRRGQQGPLSQAFVQRYESTGDVDLETCNRTVSRGVSWVDGIWQSKIDAGEFAKCKQFALQCLYQLPKSAVHLKQKCWVSK